MASGRIKGITIEIDGDTKKLSDSLSAVDKSLRQTQTSLKDVNKLLKLDPKNTELLNQKQELLKKALADSKKEVLELNKTLGEMGERNDQNADAYDRIQREIIECQQQQQQWNAQLKDMEPHVMSIKEKFGEIADKTAAVGKKLKTVGDGMTNVGKKLTTSVTAPIVGFFTLASKGASDLEENLNKVDVAFGDDAQTVKAWADNATTQFGLSKNAALEAASLFGDMGTAMGLTTGDAAEMSTNLAGLAGDLSSFKNIDVEQAMNALKGVFTGETESLKGLGIIMNQTNLKAFAEDLGLVYDEMSQAELVNLRYNYVLENTKNAQGDYARTSDGTANSIRTLQATFSNLTAELGSALLPIITPIIQKITEFAQSFAGLDEDTKNTIVTVGLVVAALGPLLTVIGTVISTIGTIMIMAPSLGAAIGALSGPIGIAVVAIGAVVAAGIALWQNWDTVKTKASELWSSIQSTFENIKNTIVEKFESAKQTVMGVVDSIKGAFNFSWSLPPIKLPHISVTGGVAPYGIAGKGSLPSFSIQWYRKAYENAVLFSRPTVLPTLGGMKGFGDGTGSEMVIGTDKLLEIVGKAGATDIDINIYTQPGMNETAIANAVAVKLDRWLGERL